MKQKARLFLIHPLVIVTVALALLGACTWYFLTLPADDRLSIETWFRSVEAMRDQPLAPLYLCAIVFIASLFLIPISGLILAAALVFQNLVGFVVTMIAMLLSAAVVHSVGRFAHKKIYAPPPRVEKMRHFFSKRGVFSIAVIRVLPIAPFHVFNFAAGYFSIPLPTFLVGSFIGLVPGTSFVFLFTTLWSEVLRRAFSENIYLIVAIAAAMIGAGSWALFRRAKRTKL